METEPIYCLVAPAGELSQPACQGSKTLTTCVYDAKYPLSKTLLIAFDSVQVLGTAG